LNIFLPIIFTLRTKVYPSILEKLL
jgi:hypothetical protein